MECILKRNQTTVTVEPRKRLDKNERRTIHEDYGEDEDAEGAGSFSWIVLNQFTSPKVNMDGVCFG